MPWQEMSPMTQRMQFIVDHQRGLYTMAELCARNQISRKTGYKWLLRYAAEGPPGLVERSHAPHVCPHRIGDKMARLLLDVRDSHPSWGPKKLVDFLSRRHRHVASGRPSVPLPSCSSGAGSCVRGAVDAAPCIRAPCRSTRRRPMICGPPTSKDSSSLGTALLLPAHDRRPTDALPPPSARIAEHAEQERAAGV